MTIYALPQKHTADPFSKLFWGQNTVSATENSFPDLPAAGTTGEAAIVQIPIALITDVVGLSTDSIDPEMGRLESAAKNGDEPALIQAANAIDWSGRPAEDYLRAIRLALTAGAHLKARKLSAQGMQQYPQHAELQQFARILAAPKILPDHPPADPSIRLNRDWLMAHFEDFRGRWVALKAGQLLGQALTFEELIAVIGDPQGKHILITRV